MGYIRHHAIVVTSWKDSAIEQAHEVATKLFTWVSPISPPAVNGYRTFFVPPDGSKEGWEDSNKGNDARDALVTYMKSVVYEDGSRPLAWFEAQYGEDDYNTKITRDSDEYMRDRT